MEIPTLPTKRLILRGFKRSDAKRVQQLAGDVAIADTTRNLPHPYPDGMAEAWIKTHRPDFRDGKNLCLAICLTEDQQVIGAVSLVAISAADQNAELGYWVGKPYWNQGYASEAAARLVGFGFKSLNLHRIYAHHLSRNPASGKVLFNIGMRHEGRLREAVVQWGKFEDIEIYGLLKTDLTNLAE